MAIEISSLYERDVSAGAWSTYITIPPGKSNCALMMFFSSRYIDPINITVTCDGISVPRISATTEAGYGTSSLFGIKDLSSGTYRIAIQSSTVHHHFTQIYGVYDTLGWVTSNMIAEKLIYGVFTKTLNIEDGALYVEHTYTEHGSVSLPVVAGSSQTILDTMQTSRIFYKTGITKGSYTSSLTYPSSTQSQGATYIGVEFIDTTLDGYMFRGGCFG